MSAVFLWIVWVIAALIAGGLMFGAWTGPHRAVSNLSRWAVRLRVRHLPGWLTRRSADRWAFRGGLLAMVLLLGVVWFIPSRQSAISNDNGDVRRDVAPVPPADRAVVDRPDRQIDNDLKNAILLNVPKTKQVKIVVLRGDPEADRFAWQIDGFLREQNYKVSSPHVFFLMSGDAAVPSGTTLYPDQSDPNIFVIRIGMNDRSQ